MFERLIKFFIENGCRVKEWDDSIVANNTTEHLKIDVYKDKREIYIYDTVSGNLIEKGIIRLDADFM